MLIWINIHLLTEQKASNIETKLLEARYKFGMVLIGIALLRVHDNGEAQSSNGEDNIFTKIRNITSAVSPVLLPMISSLGDLDIDATPMKDYEES